MRRAQQQVVVALVALVLASVDDAAGFALSSSRGRAAERTTVVSMNKGFGGGATPKPGKGSKKKGKAASTQTKSASDVDAMKAALGESGLITLGKEWSGFQFAGNVRPGPQTPMRTTPAGIAVPDYAQDGVPKTKGPRMPWQVEVKTPEDIEGMRAAGRVAREVLDAAGRMVKPGIATDAIDQLVHEEGVKRGAYPSPLNYHNFPKSVCTSINEVICHGIPDTTSVLKDGDIINIDVTVYYKGYHGDCSEMFMVGEVDDKGKDLLQVTYDCWVAAMNFCEPGRPYKDIGGVIEDHVTKHGYKTVRNFCGHGIGKIFHTNPNILHYRNNEPNGVMQVGHTFTIEPMICEGTDKVLFWPDKWTATTADGGRSAQFEHTLLMTEDGVVPLTGKLETSVVQPWEEEGGHYLGRTYELDAWGKPVN